MEQPGILIISDKTDSVSNNIAKMLRKKGAYVDHITPGILGSLKISFAEGTFSLNGNRVCGIFLRATPDSLFSNGFVEDDRSFCDAEIRAILLAAINNESILALNQYDAIAWFEGLGWTEWRRRLIQANLAVSDFVFGDNDNQLNHFFNWYPYTGASLHPLPGPSARGILGSAITENTPQQTNLIVNGQVISGESTDSVLTAMKVLEQLGIKIAEIIIDNNNKIFSVNTQPSVGDDKLKSIVSQKITEMFYEHLCNW